MKHLMCVFVFISIVKNGNAAGVSTSTTTKPISSKSPASNSVTTAIVPPITTTRRPLVDGLRLPCSCLEGQCGCCTGVILERFKQKACMNITYEPDEFAFLAALSLNGRVLYKNSISGKNPPPICIRLPRFRFIQLCVEFSNIYFSNRNMHVCIDMEANWESLTLLDFSFDCVRMGINGVAVVGPAEGGGLPASSVDEEEQTDEDYDDDARDAQLLGNGTAGNEDKHQTSKNNSHTNSTALQVKNISTITSNRHSSRKPNPVTVSENVSTKHFNRTTVTVKRLKSGDFLITFDGQTGNYYEDYH